MSTDIGRWQALELWTDGDDQVSSAIQAASHIREVSGGSTLLSSGDTSSDVLFILSGCFSIVRYSANGHEVRLNTLNEGEWVGEMAALNQRPRNAFVIAVEDSCIAMMPKQRFLELMNKYGSFSSKIAQQLSDRLDETSQRMFEFAAASSSDRVYSELIRLSSSELNSNQRQITPSPSVTELAARLSMARETASRTINRLERMRLLKREPNCWRVIAPQDPSDISD